MSNNSLTCLAGLILLLQFLLAFAQVNYNISCSSKQMKVSVLLNNPDSILYLDKLKSYPECQPEIKNGRAVFRLPLDNFYACGTVRVLNKLTGQKIFYHRIIVEHPLEPKEVILAKCVLPAEKHTFLAQNRTRRNILPPNFIEPDYVNITQYIEQRAPVPYLSLFLKQNGRVLDTTYNVQPGTPLEMVIFLDDKSAGVYGLLASYLKVTDNSPRNEEVIIMNGCSIDPYIFGNFITHDGDTLTARFKAFKFPQSNYVLFVGTVNVCIDKCQGVPCGDGQYGYGRKRRSIPAKLPDDPNKVFEVEMSTFLKIEYEEDHFKLNQGNLAAHYDDDVSSLTKINYLPYTEDKTGGAATICPQLILLYLVLLVASRFIS